MYILQPHAFVSLKLSLSMSYRPHIEASCKVLKKTVEVFDVPILRDVVTEYIIYGFNKCEEIMIHT